MSSYVNERYTLTNKRFLDLTKKGRRLSDDQCQQLISAAIPACERSREVVELIKAHGNDISGLYTFFKMLRNFGLQLIKKETIETTNLFDYLLVKFTGPEKSWESNGMKITRGVISRLKGDNFEIFIIELSLWVAEFQQLMEDRQHIRIMEELLQLPPRTAASKGEEKEDFMDKAVRKLQEYTNRKKMLYDRRNRSVPKMPEAAESLFLFEDMFEQEEELGDAINKSNPWDLQDFYDGVIDDSEENAQPRPSRTNKRAELEKELRPDELFNEFEIASALKSSGGDVEAAVETLRRRRKEQIDRVKQFFPRCRDTEIIRQVKRAGGDLSLAYLSLSYQEFQRAQINPDIYDGNLVPLLNGSCKVKRKTRVVHAEKFADQPDGVARARLLVKLFETARHKEAIPKEWEEWWRAFDEFQFDEVLSFVMKAKVLDSIEEVYTCEELNKECCICMDQCPNPEVFKFPCECLVCNNCMMQFVKHNIDKGGKVLMCPMCKDENIDDTRVFSHLQILSRRNDSYREIFDKFETVHSMNAMHGMTDFTRCAHPPCSSGFVRPPGAPRRMICNTCGKKTCHDCKLPWLIGHKNKRCEDYKKWLEVHRPDLYIPAELEGSTYVICPQCKGKYELARGGCLHFLCPQCEYEFCGFCQQPFHKPNKNPCQACDVSKAKGIHAHHPRNCPYFLRDREIDWLWKLIEEHEMAMDDILPPNETTKDVCDLSFDADDGSRSNCELPQEERCQGYCERHFKELLSGAIFKRKEIDPLKLMTKDEMKVLADRENLPFEEGWSEDEARAKLMEASPLDNE